jgi:cyclic pyranopterin phosphate synthase
MTSPALTHLDTEGRARMVDVSGKAETARYARARGVVRMSPAAAARLKRTCMRVPPVNSML